MNHRCEGWPTLQFQFCTFPTMITAKSLMQRDEKYHFFNRRWRSAPSAGLIPALDDLIKLQANFTIGRCGKEIFIIPVLQASHYHKDSDIVLRPTCSPASSHGNYHCWIRGPSRQVDRLLHQHPKYKDSAI